MAITAKTCQTQTELVTNQRSIENSFHGLFPVEYKDLKTETLLFQGENNSKTFLKCQVLKPECPTFNMPFR